MEQQSITPVATEKSEPVEELEMEDTKVVYPADNSQVPPKLWCFKCRDKMDITEVSIITTTFSSKLKGVPMVRDTWSAKCATCGTHLRSFKKH